MRTIKYLVAGVLLAGPAVAFASSGGEGLGALISLAPGSMLYTLLTFIILLLVLWKFAWGPIVKGLEAREDKIHGAIEQAQKDREEAEKLLRDYEEKLKKASQEISERLSKADKEAETRIEKARQEAREEGERIVNQARQEIEAERDKATAEIRQQMTDIAARIAGAAIGESFDKDDHMRIIRKRLEQVENPS